MAETLNMVSNVAFVCFAVMVVITLVYARKIHLFEINKEIKRKNVNDVKARSIARNEEIAIEKTIEKDKPRKAAKNKDRSVKEEKEIKIEPKREIKREEKRRNSREALKKKEVLDEPKLYEEKTPEEKILEENQIVHESMKMGAIENRDAFSELDELNAMIEQNAENKRIERFKNIRETTFVDPRMRQKGTNFIDENILEEIDGIKGTEEREEEIRKRNIEDAARKRNLTHVYHKGKGTGEIEEPEQMDIHDMRIESESVTDQKRGEENRERREEGPWAGQEMLHGISERAEPIEEARGTELLSESEFEEVTAGTEMLGTQMMEESEGTSLMDEGDIFDDFGTELMNNNGTQLLDEKDTMMLDEVKGTAFLNHEGTQILDEKSDTQMLDEKEGTQFLNESGTQLLDDKGTEMLEEGTQLLEHEGTSLLDESGTEFLNEEEGTQLMDNEGTSLLNEDYGTQLLGDDIDELTKDEGTALMDHEGTQMLHEEGTSLLDYPDGTAMLDDNEDSESKM